MEKTYVFPKTIKELDQKIEDLNREMTENLQREIASKTGGDNWHNPNKVIQEGQQRTLTELVETKVFIKEISPPKQIIKVDQGHLIQISGIEGKKKLLFHLGSDIDTKMLSNIVNKGNVRVASVDSAIGRQVMGRKKGDSFEVGDVSYKIEKIEASDLCRK